MRTASNEGLCDKAFAIATDPTYDEYQRRLASMVYESFDKRSLRLEKYFLLLVEVLKIKLCGTNN